MRIVVIIIFGVDIIIEGSCFALRFIISFVITFLFGSELFTDLLPAKSEMIQRMGEEIATTDARGLRAVHVA